MARRAADQVAAELLDAAFTAYTHGLTTAALVGAMLTAVLAVSLIASALPTRGDWPIGAGGQVGSRPAGREVPSGRPELEDTRDDAQP